MDNESTARIVIAQNINIPLLESGVHINRLLLSEHLPASHINDIRIRKVSRHSHCFIFRDGTHWYIVAHISAYLNDERLNIGSAEVLPAGASKLMLGTEGFLIEIYV